MFREKASVNSEAFFVYLMNGLKKVVIDQMGNEVKFDYPPKRIVSLVPSQTELLYDLGLWDRVVGITKFCELPLSWHKTKTKVGGTKRLRIDSIDALRPDLIIGNKEENDKESIETLQRKYPVWMSDIVTLQEALWMINSIAELTDTITQGKIITKKIGSAFAQIKKREASVLYLIWRGPWMGAGANTFINTMLEHMGLTNVLANNKRYPVLTKTQIQDLDPDYVFLSSEPYPFQEKHFSELQDILPHSKLTLVDGQFFSWYGSRLLQAPDYFNSLLT
ncbi:MAG: helical backbone metal receptor [Cyclobacteriaceae bacterium]